MSPRHHTSYVLRCWELDERDERIEIEHIQRRATSVVHSLEDAVEWIRTAHHATDPDPQPNSTEYPVRSTHENKS